LAVLAEQPVKARARARPWFTGGPSDARPEGLAERFAAGAWATRHPFLPAGHANQPIPAAEALTYRSSVRRAPGSIGHVEPRYVDRAFNQQLECFFAGTLEREESDLSYGHLARKQPDGRIAPSKHQGRRGIGPNPMQGPVGADGSVMGYFPDPRGLGRQGTDPRRELDRPEATALRQRVFGGFGGMGIEDGLDGSPEGTGERDRGGDRRHESAVLDRADLRPGHPRSTGQVGLRP
jgi:hypothetical protein